MSLTSFLKDSVEVRQRFKIEFVMPPLGTTKQLAAPPLTQNYSLVGTAFDYLLRFYVERLNPESKSGEWIAEKGALCDEIEVDGHRFDIAGTVEKAKAAQKQYLQSGKVDDKLLRAVLNLAQLDAVARRGDESYYEKLDKIDRKDVQDLQQLISLVKPETFKAKKVCALNPTLGRASELVGGADCDMVIDDTLIEIKTTKKFEVKREYFDQIIGYYILFRIGGIDGLSKTHSIKKLGIYFSRYGHLWLFKVSDVIDEKKLPKFISWFRKQARQEF